MFETLEIIFAAIYLVCSIAIIICAVSTCRFKKSTVHNLPTYEESSRDLSVEIGPELPPPVYTTQELQ
jgi:hypothetical protein